MKEFKQFSVQWVKTDPKQATLLLNFRTSGVKKGSSEERIWAGKREKKKQNKSCPNSEESEWPYNSQNGKADTTSNFFLRSIYNPSVYTQTSVRVE